MNTFSASVETLLLTGSQKKGREITPLVTLIHTADAMAADLMERPYTTL